MPVRWQRPAKPVAAAANGATDPSAVAEKIQMPNIEPFERHAERYESWFVRHPAAYQSELNAVRALWPGGRETVEIGVGAGHFAAPLGIALGVEPSTAMRRAASRRGIEAVEGVAEQLPFPNACFEAALMVTTLCFVDDPARSVAELARVLRLEGVAVIGFVDRESRLGRDYEARRASSVFYRDAHFFSTVDVADLLTRAGFEDLTYCQTLFGDPSLLERPDEVREGYGEGSFVVIRGRKPKAPPC